MFTLKIHEQSALSAAGIIYPNVKPIQTTKDEPHKLLELKLHQAG